MRLIFLLTAALALAACSIKSNRPDYQYPEGSDATGADWPELAVTSELAAAGASVSRTAEDNQESTERLAARARALRARAARLQRDAAN